MRIITYRTRRSSVCNNKRLAELELIYKMYYNHVYDFEGSNIKCKVLWGTIRTLYRQKICFHSLGHYGVIIPLSFVLKRTVKKSKYSCIVKYIQYVHSKSCIVSE